ncbi:hypothetical protein [Pseudoalteromonas arctica]|uniref:Orphan protein n=1 Tax=Pseudoalteromonas arctica TaxID=394751 RepID=A0ABU9TGH1_9GAMM
MTRKSKVTLIAPQKLEYAKLMVEEGYTNKQNLKKCLAQESQQYHVELNA